MSDGNIVDTLKMTHAATTDPQRSRELTADERAAWDAVAETGSGVDRLPSPAELSRIDESVE